MHYQLSLTDRSTHTSHIYPVPSIDNVILILNNHFKSIINTELIDDDQPSIQINTNNLNFSYYYQNNQTWFLQCQSQYFISKTQTQSNLTWLDLLDQWRHLLVSQISIFEFIFSNINKVPLSNLERLFATTMFLPRTSNQLVLLIKNEV